jgi:hypothetical protein
MARSREASKVMRAFDLSLLMAPLTVKLVRRGPKPVEKLVTCVYDHAQEMFKIAAEHTIEIGDRLSLDDGRTFEVTTVTKHSVEGTDCFLEVVGKPVS